MSKRIPAICLMLASLLLLSPWTLNAQSSGKATVSGTVIEQSTGEPLVGVAVYIAGTAQNAVQKPVSLHYKGTEYPMRKHLDTILLIGTDSVEQYEEKET